MTTTTTLEASVDARAVPLARAASTLAQRVPFRAPPTPHGHERAPWRGRLPSWLRGELVRVGPAALATEHWSAAHWFDALGLAVGFDLRSGTEVELRWSALECRAATAAHSGKVPLAQFASPNQRSRLRRLLQPVPQLTDNANVNVVRMGREWIAMTETPHQLILDDRTLRVRGEVHYTDQLRGYSPLAHPIVAGDAVTNLASKLGPRTAVTLYRHRRDARQREPLATWHTRDYPYIHSFGLTARHAIIVDHPLRLRPMNLLWSNRGVIEHFTWQPREPTRLWLLGLLGGRHHSYETEPLFCFHTVHAFDSADTTVLDLLAYDDASIVARLSVRRLAEGFPATSPQLLRLTIDRKTGKVSRRVLSDVGFEFPQVDWERASGSEERCVFGVKLLSAGLTLRSEIVRVAISGEATCSFSAGDYVLGEPVFVGAPLRRHEAEGVLLSVGSSERGSALFVLDATTLDVIAHAEFFTQLPLGFHGSFMRV